MTHLSMSRPIPPNIRRKEKIMINEETNEDKIDNQLRKAQNQKQVT